MWRSVLDLLLPPRCAGCGSAVAEGLCEECADAAERLLLPTMAQVTLAPDVVAVGLFAYDGVIRDALQRMKVAGGYAAAGSLGRLLHTRLGLPVPTAGLSVTWVPATRRRRRQRGADLPQLLAGPAAVRLLQRTSERPDQTDLSAEDRRHSPAGSFAAVGRPPPSVVLIDDVRTTGATALAAAQALQAAGTERVLVATLAVAGRFSGRDRSGTGR